MRLGRPDPNKPVKPPSSPEYRAMHMKLGYLAIAVIINVIGFSILFPIAPYYVSRALGPGVDIHDPRIAELSAWLTAIYAVMQFLFAPIWGRLSDRIGRKPILIGSLIGDAIFYTMFGLSHALVPLFIARVLAGVFSSATLAVAQAYVADVTPPDYRAQGLGMIGASFGVGFILGPALGGGLGSIGLSIPLFVAAALALVNLAYIVKYLPESRPAGTDAEPTGPPAGVGARLGAMAGAVTGSMGYMYLLTFAVTFAFGNLEGTFTSYLMQQMGFSSKGSVAAQGWIFTYIGFIIVLVQGGAIRPMVKKYGEAPLVLFGIASMAVGFLLFPLTKLAPLHAQLPILMLGPMVLISVGNGFNTPALRALISRKASSSTQGATLGLSASFDSLARAVGPATAGYIYDKISPQAPYWCAGIVMGLSLLIALSNLRDLKAASAVSVQTAVEEMVITPAE